MAALADRSPAPVRVLVLDVLLATDFFKYREAQQTGVDAKAADLKNGAYPV